MSLNPFSALAAKVYGALFIASVSFAAVQTVRIEGFWLITGLEQKLSDARSALTTEKKGRANDADAWRRQVANAQAATAAAEIKSQETASHAQTTHDALAADNAGLRGYIASHRVRAGSNPAAPAGSADDLGAAVPADAAAGTLLAASEADLVLCDAGYVYGASAYDWAQGLIATGLAAPPAP